MISLSPNHLVSVKITFSNCNTVLKTYIIFRFGIHICDYICLLRIHKSSSEQQKKWESYVIYIQNQLSPYIFDKTLTVAIIHEI